MPSETLGVFLLISKSAVSDAALNLFVLPIVTFTVYEPAAVGLVFWYVLSAAPLTLYSYVIDLLSESVSRTGAYV